ncbi:hypothetical protein OH77DRAFT_139092 [Trametes cingulata]|nr:hypothetical protein OH77DRAFT_139092 [Trametes cingulata]
MYALTDAASSLATEDPELARRNPLANVLPTRCKRTWSAGAWHHAGACRTDAGQQPGSSLPNLKHSPRDTPREPRGKRSVSPFGPVARGRKNGLRKTWTGG